MKTKHRHLKSTKVLITDKETGLEYGFVSLAKASRFMGRSKDYITHYCRNNVTETDGWTIKRFDIEEESE